MSESNNKNGRLVWVFLLIVALSFCVLQFAKTRIEAPRDPMVINVYEPYFNQYVWRTKSSFSQSSHLYEYEKTDTLFFQFWDLCELYYRQGLFTKEEASKEEAQSYTQYMEYFQNLVDKELSTVEWRDTSLSYLKKRIKYLNDFSYYNLGLSPYENPYKEYLNTIDSTIIVYYFLNEFKNKTDYTNPTDVENRIELGRYYMRRFPYLCGNYQLNLDMNSFPRRIENDHFEKLSKAVQMLNSSSLFYDNEDKIALDPDYYDDDDSDERIWNKYSYVLTPIISQVQIYNYMADSIYFFRHDVHEFDQPVSAVFDDFSDKIKKYKYQQKKEEERKRNPYYNSYYN